MGFLTPLMFVITPARIYNPQEGELPVEIRFQANRDMITMPGWPGSSLIPPAFTFQARRSRVNMVPDHTTPWGSYKDSYLKAQFESKELAY
jgi:hypothetical protein